MFNIYVGYDMYMFNMPSTTLSHMHIIPNHVIFNLYVLFFMSPDFFLGKLETEHYISHVLLNMPIYVCQSIFMSVCLNIF